MQQEETRQARGKLKSFFGATAGVGKTYAMLEAAHARRAEGVDIVVGWVDTHGRVETEVLLQRLAILPCRPVTYDWVSYAWGLGSVALCTVLSWQLFPHFAEANLIMLYLLRVAVVAMRSGRGPALWASVLSVAAFDFFFVLPYLTFSVAALQLMSSTFLKNFIARRNPESPAVPDWV